MADAAVGLLLENLTQVVRHNVDLIWEAKDEMEGLIQDLKVFKGVIRDFTEQRGKSHGMLELVNSIRGVVEEAEDVIDKLLVEKAMYRNMSAFKRATYAVGHYRARKKVGETIESVRRRIRLLYTDKQFVFMTEMSEPSKSTLDIKQQQQHPAPPDYVVGFKEEAEIVIRQLMHGDKELEIISIVGMPGLGKTTLARMIYNDPRIEYEFFTRIWVYVSRIYNEREILLSILRAITSYHPDLSNDDLLLQVRKHLEHSKYFIVMDDVWSTEFWRDLKDAFPDNRKSSRILITTRDNHVAFYTNPRRHPFFLKFLTPQESLELLMKKVFFKGDEVEAEVDVEVEDITKRIAQSCKGLPMAIVVIAGVILNNPQSTEWWKQVAENVNSFLYEDQDYFLGFSYDHLPYHLKTCFLYLGVYPENYEISVSRLILLWIAEGFVEERGTFSLEQTAQHYVEELVNRSLLIAVKRGPNGKTKTCYLHNMVHSFCEMESKKQMLYRVITSTSHKPHQNLSSLDDEYRRISIQVEDVNQFIPSKTYGSERVRSFLCFPASEIHVHRDHMSTIPRAFQLLRVLELKNLTFENFPKDLLLLSLLRYLAITCKVKALPAFISRLWNMQTLIFFTSSRTLDFPRDVWKMYHLRHLLTNASAQLPPPPSNTPCNKESVQSLSRISPESCTKGLFERTPNIKKLGIRGKVALLFNESLFHNIGNLEHLTNLKLFNDIAFATSTSSPSIINLPPPHEFPPMLLKLTLSETSLDWEQMKILEKLLKLEELKLKDNAFRGDTWRLTEGSFPSLRLLHIMRTDLETWEAASKHCFPRLTCLSLQHCDRLRGLPLALADVTTLKLLDLYFTNPSAVDSARKIMMRKLENNAGDTHEMMKLSIYPPEI